MNIGYSVHIHICMRDLYKLQCSTYKILRDTVYTNLAKAHVRVRSGRRASVHVILTLTGRTSSASLARACWSGKMYVLQTLRGAGHDVRALRRETQDQLALGSAEPASDRHE